MKNLLLSILLTLLPILASAEPVEIDGFWYNLVSKIKEAEVTRNPKDREDNGSYSGNIEIPASVTYNNVKYSVTSIGEYAFSFCKSLTSVTIPNSVTSIGKVAFLGCAFLESVKISNSLMSIGNNAFENCSSMTSVHISNLKAWYGIKFYNSGSNPLSYAHHLYLNGEEIKNLVIPNDVTSIGDYIFSGCSGLTSVTIPNGVTSIGSGAFWGCSGLTSVIIPNGVTIIGSGAFGGCSGLTSVTIPNSVTDIGNSAFSGCSGLTSFTIPNCVTGIGYSTFINCSGLISVTIPNSVTSIGNNAFSRCSSLTSVNIPNSVISIGNNAFDNCSSLASVTIGYGIKSISGSAFANCQDLADVTCLAEKLRTEAWYSEGLYTYANAFDGSYIDYATLHVPAAAIEAYKTTTPWSGFKNFVTIGEGEIPDTPKCATPEISYSNGKVSLSCETEGVEFISEVTIEDAKKYYDSEFTLSQTYKITVYATKAGYENSDVATREIVIENGQTTLFGDINKDGKVNVADHVKLSDIIMNK